jgi:hypothetical protein
MRKRTIVITLAVLAMMITGCHESEQQRLVEMAERQLDRQAEQSRRMAELQREVAEGSRQLVEADAKAREEIVALQRDIQAERSEIGRQRDTLETERRDLAAKRRLDPIIAAAITNVGMLLGCLLPLVVCWYLLREPPEQASDQEMAALLIEDLVADQPLLLGSIRPRGSETETDRPKLRLHDTSRPDEPAT